MASPQLENGFTRISNELLEATSKFPFNGSQLRMILFLWRKTYGYSKKVDRISISQWKQGTNLNERTIRRELKALKQMNVIQQISDD